MADESLIPTDPQGETPRDMWDLRMPYDVPTTLERLRKLREMGTPEEQRETFEVLKKALNENRLPGYEIFPEEDE